MGASDQLNAFYERHSAWVWAVALLAPVAALAVGLVVAPQTFWDHYLWENIWGPIWADAHQCPNTAQCTPQGPNPSGVVAKDGYTVTSEITYGLVLAVSLYVIFKGIFRRFEVRTDGRWVAALLPFILLGPLTRTLEDADVFIGRDGAPGVFAYLFISPVIYVQIAAYTIAFLLLGIAIERARARLPWTVLTATVAAVLATMTVAYALVGASYGHGFSAFAPGWVFALGAVAGVLFFAHYAYRGEAGVNATLFALGLPLPLPSVYLIGSWVTGSVWSERVFNGTIHTDAGGAIVALASLAVLAVAVLAALGARLTRGTASASFATYLGGLNLALVFGHMLDAFATWIALIDPFRFGLPRYAEKHPFSDLLLQIGTGTPFQGLGFPVAKLVMILGVIWLLDREFKEESPGDFQLVGLIKMAILVLGFAPGLRDLLRITMGV